MLYLTIRSVFTGANTSIEPLGMAPRWQTRPNVQQDNPIAPHTSNRNQHGRRSLRMVKGNVDSALDLVGISCPRCSQGIVRCYCTALIARFSLMCMSVCMSGSPDKCSQKHMRHKSIKSSGVSDIVRLRVLK